MTPTHDLIAINERGVYAICYDDGSPEAGEFAAEARRRGDRVERVALKEACDRHLAYLSGLPAFRGVLPLPSIGL